MNGYRVAYMYELEGTQRVHTSTKAYHNCNTLNLGEWCHLVIA